MTHKPSKVYDEEIDSAMAAVGHPDAPYDPAALILAAAVRQLRAQLERAQRFQAKWRRQAMFATAEVNRLQCLLDQAQTTIRALVAPPEPRRIHTLACGCSRRAIFHAEFCERRPKMLITSEERRA